MNIKKNERGIPIVTLVENMSALKFYSSENPNDYEFVIGYQLENDLTVYAYLNKNTNRKLHLSSDGRAWKLYHNIFGEVSPKAAIDFANQNKALSVQESLTPDQKAKAACLSNKLFGLGVDPVVLLHQAIKDARTSKTNEPVRSCINCKEQRTCTVRDMALHLTQVEMSMITDHSLEQYSHEIFSITAENCLNYCVIPNWGKQK